MKKILSSALFLFVLVLFVSVLFMPVIYVNAETHIPGGSIAKDTIWSATGSPYILDGSLDIPYKKTLTIEPGVIIDTNLVGDNRPSISVSIMKGK